MSSELKIKSKLKNGVESRLLLLDHVHLPVESRLCSCVPVECVSRTLSLGPTHGRCNRTPRWPLGGHHTGRTWQLQHGPSAHADTGQTRCPTRGESHHENHSQLWNIGQMWHLQNNLYKYRVLKRNETDFLHDSKTIKATHSSLLNGHNSMLEVSVFSFSYSPLFKLFLITWTPVWRSIMKFYLHYLLEYTLKNRYIRKGGAVYIYKNVCTTHLLPHRLMHLTVDVWP